MKIIYHPADSRGDANHGWLHSRHSFSFASYYNPERMNFGALRVLNDDRVAGGMGFGTHPHENMEIISIPLEGDLVHKDSMGNETVIKNGDVQIMSAGTGIKHSEKNKNQDKEVKFLQIWVIPKVADIEPRYDQVSLNKAERKNKWQQIVSPDERGPGVRINQNAWFSLVSLDAKKDLTYDLNDTQNGVYLFLLEGKVKIEDVYLERRDGLGIVGVDRFKITAEQDSEILLMEVPMLK